MGDQGETVLILQRFIIIIIHNHNNLHGVVYTCTVGVSGVHSPSIQKELAERMLRTLMEV